MKEKRELPKQSLWGKIFQKLLTATVYFLFRPKIVWEDKKYKKLLKNQNLWVSNYNNSGD